MDRHQKKTFAFDLAVVHSLLSNVKVRMDDLHKAYYPSMILGKESEEWISVKKAVAEAQDKLAKYRESL